MRARCFSDGRRTWSRVSSQDIRDKNLRELSIVDYQSLLHDRVANTQELIRAHLDVAKEQQQRCNFFTPQSLSSPECERIMQEAKQADDMRLFASTDERLSRPLHGVPIAVKQNICQRDKETSAGSAMLHSFVSPYDATVVQRLRDAGAILVGQTVMDEFGMGASTSSGVDGACRNPHDTTRTAGGSSGGSAASVASTAVVAALGSDTGGSVRQPAAHCGVYGLRPTYGRVSRHGLVSYASSLDTIGWMTRHPADLRVLLNVLQGVDGKDETIAENPLVTSSAASHKSPYMHQSIKSLTGITIGIPKEYFVQELQPEILNSWKETIEKLQKKGAKIKSISLPHTSVALPTYYVIASAEASSNLSRYDGVRYGRNGIGKSTKKSYVDSRTENFGEEVQRRILLGTFVLSRGSFDQFYGQALQIRQLVVDDFQSVFGSIYYQHPSLKRRKQRQTNADVDLILTPTTPSTAFKLDQINPTEMYAHDVMTVASSLAGLPAVSMPVASSSATSSLPVGMQLIAPRFGDELLIDVASIFNDIAKN